MHPSYVSSTLSLWLTPSYNGFFLSKKLLNMKNSYSVLSSWFSAQKVQINTYRHLCCVVLNIVFSLPYSHMTLGEVNFCWLLCQIVKYIYISGNLIYGMVFILMHAWYCSTVNKFCTPFTTLWQIEWWEKVSTSKVTLLQTKWHQQSLVFLCDATGRCGHTSK